MLAALQPALPAAQCWERINKKKLRNSVVTQCYLQCCRALELLDDLLAALQPAAEPQLPPPPPSPSGASVRSRRSSAAGAHICLHVHNSGTLCFCMDLLSLFLG